MSRTMKWILGIGIVLVLLVILAGVGLLVFSRINGAYGMMGGRQVLPWGDGRLMPWRNMPMNPFFRMPGHMYRGFFPLRFIGGGFLGLGILVLVVLGIIGLFYGLRRPQPVSTPVQQTTSAAVAAPVVEAQPAAEAAPTHNCPNCGRQVFEDWNHCPYCGTQLT